MKRLTLLLISVLATLTAAVTILSSLAGWLPWHLQTMSAGTMEPAIPKGSLLVITRQSIDEYKAGTAVAYRSPGRPALIARIIRVTNQSGEDRYVLSTDQGFGEYPVAADAIVGRVRWHWLFVAKPYQWLRSWAGLVAGLYLPAVGLVAYEVNLLARKLADFSLE